MESWRNSLEPEQRRRAEQVEAYGRRYGYDLDSDQELIAKLVQLTRLCGIHL